QPVGARRLDLPDVDRRQSAAVDLRHHRTAGQRAGQPPDGTADARAGGRSRLTPMIRRLLGGLAALIAIAVLSLANWLHGVHHWHPAIALLAAAAVPVLVDAAVLGQQF